MKHLLLGVMACLCLSACGKSDDASSSGGSSGDSGGSESGSKAASSESLKPWEDTSKPYLSDQKMGDFISSLKAENSPFDEISKGTVTPLNASGKMNAFEAAAKKHGFASGEEYFGAWMRINSANTLVMQEESNRSLIKMQEESIKTAQEALKRPDLTAEMREAYENQVKGAQEAIQAMNQPVEGGLNAQDLATFKKHKAAFEEAMKKWTK
jgi:hypothetical protein